MVIRIYDIPNMDDPFDREAAIASADAYERITDAEHITDDHQVYTFAAHRSARHLHAALKKIKQLERVHREWSLVMNTLIDGLAERDIPVELGTTYARAALDEIDRLRAALGPRHD